ncbi:MAG: hypothetical protein Q7U91_10580 [Sideroxyarcus sp.]|nr:hypothetical protein [Sideroxyarcus sp.]
MVIKKLDSAGIAPKVLQTFSESIYKVLQRPMSALGNSDELVLYRKDGGVWKTGTPPMDSAAIELRIPLRNARAQLLRYTGAHLISGTTEMSLLASIQDTGSLAARAVRSGRRKSQ